MGKHSGPREQPVGPGPHPTPEQSQALADSFDANQPEQRDVKYPAIENYENKKK